MTPKAVPSPGMHREDQAPSSLVDIELSARAIKALVKAGIREVEVLRNMPVRRLIRIPDIGRKTAKEITRKVRAIPDPRRAEIPRTWATLGETIDHFFSELPLRERAILNQRLGMTVEEIPTLTALADRYGISRERVRQIERRLRRRLLGRLRVRAPQRLKELEQFLAASEAASFQEVVTALGESLKSRSHAPVAVLRIVVSVLGEGYLILERGRAVARRARGTEQ